MKERNCTKRERILFAAAEIVVNVSVSNFTLDRVAKEANISKGGLLYYFPTKEAIIEGMIELPMKRFIEGIEERLKNDKINTGKWSRAYTIESFTMPEDMKLLWIGGLVSALAINSKLLMTWMEMFNIWQKKFENDQIDQTTATIIRLVTDGVWFLDLLDLEIIKPDMRKSILESLLKKTTD